MCWSMKSVAKAVHTILLVKPNKIRKTPLTRCTLSFVSSHFQQLLHSKEINRQFPRDRRFAVEYLLKNTCICDSQ